jgi:hypothetical protein
MSRYPCMTALVIAASLSLALAACGGSDATAPDTVANIAGTWNLSETFSNSSQGISCNATGNVLIAQTGATFTGQVTGSTATCTTPSGPFTSNVDGSITGGQINGNSVTYSDGTCNWTGTVSGSPINRVSGNLNCTLAVSGQNYPFSGTWQITR